MCRGSTLLAVGLEADCTESSKDQRNIVRLTFKTKNRFAQPLYLRPGSTLQTLRERTAEAHTP